MKKYDAAIILGGGRYNNDQLTPLSIQRLNKGYNFYQKKFFNKFPGEISKPDLFTWFKDHVQLYYKFKKIRDKYHPPGKESQAYVGVKK